MKKKILAVIVAMLLICAPLTACNESYKEQAVEGKQDTSYAVISNGGSAVQYGNYVYYINGYRGYDDEDGEQNYWGNVTKGALYRAELIGTDAYFDYVTAFGTTGKKDVKTFASSFDVQSELSFVSSRVDVVTGYQKDEDGEIVYDGENPVEIKESVYEAKTVRIASKTIGTSGYADGGIFIYDEHVYYASPSNEQNRNGEFETTKTAFFRTNLDGTGTVKLYTTKEASDSAPYAFYKRGDNVYLTVLDGTSIISVKIGAKKAESVKEIATDVSEVLFPVKDVYYKGIDTNEAADFIYYTREITEKDPVRSGNIAVALRPDGTEAMQIIANGNTLTLMNVDGGYLFYQDAQTGGDVIMYTNLHQQFMTGSETYKTAYEANKGAIEAANGALSPLLGHQSGVALNIENIADYTTVLCYRPNKLSNQVYSVMTDGNGIYTYDGVEMVKVYGEAVANLYTVKGTDVYFSNSDGQYFATNAYTAAESNTVVTLGADMSTEATFHLDVMGDFVMMFGDVDDYASNYAMFVDLSRVDEGVQFVGQRLNEDKYDPSVELEEGDEE